MLLKAVAGTDLHVVIVGGGPLRGWIRGEVQQAGLGAQITLAGEPDDAELVAYYQAADYFLLPSTSPAEMYGIALLEAMACWKPVISTALTTGVREVNEDGVSGLVVPPGDASALRQAMERLAADATLRATLGAAGRRRVEERFTLESMIDAHLALCEELARG